MKRYSYWWGTVFIPEDKEDNLALERIAVESEWYYESGSYDWLYATEYEHDYGGIDNPNIQKHKMPMGRLLMLNR